MALNDEVKAIQRGVRDWVSQPEYADDSLDEEAREASEEPEESLGEDDEFPF